MPYLSSNRLYTISLPLDSDIAVSFAKRTSKLHMPSTIAHTCSRKYKDKVCVCAYI